MNSRTSRVRRSLRAIAAALVVGIVVSLAWERMSFDRAAWIADYEQLRRHASGAYANLLWALRERKIDPAALDRETRRRLDEASTDRQARAALADFVATFADGHFQVRRVKLSKRLEAWWASLGRAEGEAPRLDAATPGAVACDALGFHDDAGELRFGLAEAPGFQALAVEAAFPAGVFELEGSRVGIVRIPAFDQRRYRSACVRAWERTRGAIAGRCDEDCVDRFVHVEAPNRLLAELTALARALAEVDLLVVDLTGNGGGADWVDPAARVLTTKPLECPRLAFVRHPHWSARLRSALGEVEADLRAEWSPAERAALTEAQARLRRLVAEAEAPCDLSGIWDGAAPACSNLVEAPYTACGVFATPPAGAFAGARSRTELFRGFGYAYAPGAYAGRLVVLVDRRTASAAEHFTAMLADGAAATIVGERTHGAGCGYTNGGLPAILAHSGLRIDMPDCQRLRRDGSNELAGVAPDVTLDLSQADGEVALRSRLLMALAGLSR